MHTQLSLSLTCHPISQLWPHIAMAMEQAWQLVKRLVKLIQMLYFYVGLLFMWLTVCTHLPFLFLFAPFQPRCGECFPFALHLVERGLFVQLCSQSIIISICCGNITTHRSKWSILRFSSFNCWSIQSVGHRLWPALMRRGNFFPSLFDGLAAAVIYKLMMLRSCYRCGMNGEVRSD